MSPIQVTGLGGMTAAAAGANHSLTRVTPPGGTAAYQYDQLYRLTNVTAPGRSASYAYDPANRLASLTIGGTTTTYIYDGEVKRASKTVGTTTTNYAYDVNGSLPNLLTDGTLKYVYGLGLAYAVDTSGNLQVYHTDGLGSVRAITDGNGNLVEAYLTDAFGVSLGTEGTVTQPFGFTGQQQDSESGLSYLRVRYYSPTLGRVVYEARDR